MYQSAPKLAEALNCFRVDFNEMVEPSLVLLSPRDTKIDVRGEPVTLTPGMRVLLVMEDTDEHGQRDNLVAGGVVERNAHDDWSRHVKWCCRIDDNGIGHSTADPNIPRSTW